MPKQRSWTDLQLTSAVKSCKSYRAVIYELGLIPAGGNYDQVKSSVARLGLDTSHFTGARWNKGLTYNLKSTKALEELLTINSTFQSFKLKKKLFNAGLKEPRCELCGWCEMAKDGRIPVELDHINGNKHDNRISNLRILCPNCHSLQSTHRGRNKVGFKRG